jgi:hypothetical protein
MKRKIVLTGVLCVMVGMLCSAAFAAAPIGKPTAGLKTGQFRAGFDYAWGEANLELSYGGSSITLKDVETNSYLANLGYGISDDWEVYIRLGVANADFEDFDGDYGFAYGFGTKVTFAKDDKLSWGALFQMGWTKSEDTYTDTDFGLGMFDMEADFYEMQIAVGPTYEMEGWRIYGGALLYFLDGDLDVKGAGVSGSIDIEEESQFGGYVGAEFDLAENCLLYVEGQFTGDAEAIGAGVAWKF